MLWYFVLMRSCVGASVVVIALVVLCSGCGSDSTAAAGSGGDAGMGGAAGSAGSAGSAGGSAGMGGDAGSAGSGATGGLPTEEEGLFGEGWETVCKLGLCEEAPELGAECQETYDACVGRGHYPRSCRMDADRTCDVFGETGAF